jgi:hypothetical protein
MHPVDEKREFCHGVPLFEFDDIRQGMMQGP